LRLTAIHLRYNQGWRPRKRPFSGAFFIPGLKKPLFQPIILTTLTFD
jgi:hypothetical protein